MLGVGDGFAVALKSNGQVMTWGDNRLGQLGLNSVATEETSPKRVSMENGQYLTDSVIEIAVGKNHALALTSEGEVYAWGDNTHGQLGQRNRGGHKKGAVLVDIPSLYRSNDKAVAVYAGDGYSLVLTAAGAVWGWGRNDMGQLGVGYTGRDVMSPEDEWGYQLVYTNYEDYLVG